jgi:2-polyprenyl-6-methoxyphenol hydroxylase-like FAD-dependent oxidoreductase
MMKAEVMDLIQESRRVAGLLAKTGNGEIAIRADLVVGADGRSSVVREKAGLQIKEFARRLTFSGFGSVELRKTRGKHGQVR